MKQSTLALGAVLMLLTFAGFACSRTDANPAEAPDPTNDEVLVKREAPPTDQAPAGDESDAEPDAGSDVAPEPRSVVLAGGCFWCVEAVYEQLDGVIDVVSGYAGGSPETANSDAVKTGRTRHAEVVMITYDPSKITYGKILKVFFTTAHDPTTLNRQGADVGPQYRSAIFYDTPERKKIAEDYINELNDAGIFRDRIVTTLEPLEKFYLAESYHQDFAEQNPTNGYIQGVSRPKVEKTKKAYPELLKDQE